MLRNSSSKVWRAFFCTAVVTFVVSLSIGSRRRPLAEGRRAATPHAMHSEMSERPTITVGRAEADIIGADNRALQAAVDYVAGLGGRYRRDRRGRVPDARLAAPPLGRDGPRPEGQDDPPQGRRRPSRRWPSTAISASSRSRSRSRRASTVGAGVAIWDDNAGGFHTTVARITGRRGNTFSIDAPLMADCMVAGHAKAATVFPVVSGCDIQGGAGRGPRHRGEQGGQPTAQRMPGCGDLPLSRLRDDDPGLRGAGLPRRRDQLPAVERRDGRRLRQRGQHRPRASTPAAARSAPSCATAWPGDNGTDGLFLCWRVRHGVFEDNRLEGNGRFGISIGHKDSDNLLRGNHVVRNASNGVFFRDEAAGMSPHRNRLKDNVIEDNGRESGTAGIRVRGEPSGLVFEGNVIRDTARARSGRRPSASWSRTGSARSRSERTGSRRLLLSMIGGLVGRSQRLRNDVLDFAAGPCISSDCRPSLREGTSFRGAKGDTFRRSGWRDACGQRSQS